MHKLLCESLNVSYVKNNKQNILFKVSQYVFHLPKLSLRYLSFKIPIAKLAIFQVAFKAQT